MVKSGYVSSKILLLKFNFSRVKVCVVVRYGPDEGDGGERDGHEQDRWWWCTAPMKRMVKKEMDMDRTLDSIENGYRLCILGDNNVEHKLVGARKTGNGGKCKKSMQLNKSWEKEPKECVVERRD